MEPSTWAQPITIPTPHHLFLSSPDATGASLMLMSSPTAPSTNATSATSGLLVMPSTPVPGISVSAVDNEVMWGTVAQPLPWLAYQDCPVTELEEQAWELKSES